LLSLWSLSRCVLGFEIAEWVAKEDVKEESNGMTQWSKSLGEQVTLPLDGWLAICGQSFLILFCSFKDRTNQEEEVDLSAP
jgi:hypothetical protein